MDNDFPTTKRLDAHITGSRQSFADDQSSLVDEGYWHDNDLLLAAELGKALLDRNRMLEQALEKARIAEAEKTAEIEFLLKQLTELRELSQRKAAFVDEADSYNMELDRNNRRLMQQMVADKQKISRLSSNVTRLEQQVNDLLDQLAQQNMNGTDLTRFRRAGTPTVTRHSPSPTRSLSPPKSPEFCDPSRPHPQRPRSGTVRGHFIDDELVDQPQLCLFPTSLVTASWLLQSQHDPYRRFRADAACFAPISRVASWPLLNSSAQCALDLELVHPDGDSSTRQLQIQWRSQRKNSSLNNATAATTDVPQHQVGEPHMMRRSTNMVGAVARHCPRCGSQIESENEPIMKNPTEFARFDSSSAVGASTTVKSTAGNESSSHLRELQDLLDDAAFIRRLESIYSLKLRCGVPSLTASDYQPQYKQLFRDAFRLLRELKRVGNATAATTAVNQLTITEED